MGLVEYMIALEHQFLSDNTERNTIKKKRWITANRKYFNAEVEIIARRI